MNSVEITEKRALLKEEAQKMIDTCRSEIRFFTEDETKRYDEIKKELRSLKHQLSDINYTLEDNNTQKEKGIKINMEKRFSLVNAIRNVANNGTQDDVTLAVMEKGKEEMRKAGLSYAGQIQLPVNELRAVTVNAEGEDIVPTDLWDIMKPLRAKNVLVQAGAKFLTGLVGDVQIPVMDASNVTWEGETAAAKDGAPTFTHKTLSPKRLTAYVDISKQLLNQDAIGVEEAIREDIINAINSKLEATILGNEAGTTTKPEGIFYNVTPVSGVTGIEEVASIEEAVESANVIGDKKYIINPKVKAALRKAAKGDNVAESLYKDGEIDGTTALSTSHVPAGSLVYGSFDCIALGQWGNVDLVVDNYTQAVNGCVRLVVNTYWDAKVLRPEAFAFGTI